MVICAFGLFKQREIEIPSLQFENGLWYACYTCILYVLYVLFVLVAQRHMADK